MIPTKRSPTHPGEILLEEFLKPTRITQSELAQELGIPIQRINTLIHGKRGMSAETALLLAKKFRTTPEFWMNLQTSYDIYHAKIRMKSAA
ncbi:MAG: HigA family addiction module antidote protein [Chitinivibrionales bacterium]|nr:HigA family addiction module antidote protein [Chitinivibrionales bacterium]